jgi:hypothetical protein
MYDMNRRLKKIESKLNINKKQSVAEIVHFSDGPLPPDHTKGNITAHYVRFDDICSKKEQQCIV